MKKYESPVLVASDGAAESVYMASGGDCYIVSAYISQTPAEGMDYYVIQVDGRHNAKDGHHSTTRTVVVNFNQPVEYLSSNASHCIGSGTSELNLVFVSTNGSYHHNANDNLGLGQLQVKSAAGLAINSIYVTGCNRTCDQHPNQN